MHRDTMSGSSQVMDENLSLLTRRLLTPDFYFQDKTYYNKRHGAERVTQILSTVNEKCLDGEALKSQQK
jgi:hypothetical protein